MSITRKEKIWHNVRKKNRCRKIERLKKFRGVGIEINFTCYL